MAKIVYGYPTEHLVELAKEKGWILGGCLMDELEFYCKNCKASWSRKSGFSDGK